MALPKTLSEEKSSVAIATALVEAIDAHIKVCITDLSTLDALNDAVLKKYSEFSDPVHHILSFIFDTKNQYISLQQTLREVDLIEDAVQEFDDAVQLLAERVGSIEQRCERVFNMQVDK